MNIGGDGLARSRRWAIGAIGVAVALVALAPRPWAQQTYSMKLATATINDIQHHWQKQFKKRLEARAGGRLKIRIYPASQLGSIPRMIEGLLLGTVESFVTPTAFIVGTEPRFQIMDAPGVFDGPEHIHRILNDPEFRRHILGLAEKKGLKGVAIFFNSPMVILSRKPIRTFADFKGQKIRTFASPLQTAPLQRLGATPVPMPLSEVMPALQSGNIDGLLAGIPILTAFKYYDAAKAVTQTHSSMVISMGLVSKRWFDGLPADLQKIIVEEGQNAQEGLLEWAIANLARANKVWTDNGGELISLSPADKTRMMTEMAMVANKLYAADDKLKGEFENLMRYVRKYR